LPFGGPEINEIIASSGYPVVLKKAFNAFKQLTTNAIVLLGLKTHHLMEAECLDDRNVAGL